MTSSGRALVAWVRDRCHRVMSYKKPAFVGAAALLLIALGAYFGRDAILRQLGSRASIPAVAQAPAEVPLGAQSVELTETLAATVKVQPVEVRLFPTEKEAIGSIDFNGELTVQVFTPYQGRIIEAFARIGEDVQKGQTLFTIDSPDLVQATSTLISTAGVLELTTRTLARLRELAKTKAAAQKDLEQAISDQQAAEGAYRAARDAVRIFGKTEAEMDAMVAERRVDAVLVVPSPITGRITARNAAPGLLVQPGNAPAPYSVADISTMWMLANVPESDTPQLRLGQEVRAKMMAYPDRDFDGKISALGAAVDPNTHRMLVRSDIADPQHLLRPGMFATFVIRTGEAERILAVPVNGVVREGDGTMTVWTTTDRRRFFRRSVKTGLRRQGYVQILEGLSPGDLVATEGALFLSNMQSSASQ
jgi:membrane fusion protein, heavy metal efflux system